MRASSRLARFGPPLAWMAVIALLSGDVLGADATGSVLLPLLARLLPAAGPGLLHALHTVVRKLGHVVEYGILGGLWLRALDPRPRAAFWAIALSALYAVTDELHQSFVPSRTGAPLDVAIDTAGALVGVAWALGGGTVGVAGLRLLRWMAAGVAAGSLLAAGLDWSLGLAAWDLVGAGLGAAGVAWGLRRLEVRWRAG
jgi:VanZ family protein